MMLPFLWSKQFNLIIREYYYSYYVVKMKVRKCVEYED